MVGVGEVWDISESDGSAGVLWGGLWCRDLRQTMSAAFDSVSIRSVVSRSPYTSLILGNCAATLAPLSVFLTRHVISYSGWALTIAYKASPPM